MNAHTVSTPSVEHELESWLAKAPFALFAQVMGLAGLAIAWRKAAEAFGTPAVIGEAIYALAALIFIIVFAVHVARAIRYPQLPVADFRHPVDSNFVPAFTIALVLMAAGLAPYSLEGARIIWIVAAILHLIFAFLILRRWFTERKEMKIASPAWFIPVVGNILMPVIGVPLGFTIAGWFLFSVGFVFWIVLAPIITQRIFFEEALPERALPSLFILLAPPAIGGLAMLALNDGQPTVFTHVMLGFGAFIALMLASMLRAIFHTHFAVGWWALTFPSAGFASLSLSYAMLRPEPIFTIMGWAALIGASLIVLTVGARTAVALAKGELIG
ncbi:MAG: SLAC1 anion channel family protein [Pseudomonadota bacterium]